MRIAFFILTAIVFSDAGLVAQQLRLSGVLLDALTKEKVPYATLELEGKEIGTLSDDNGNFLLVLEASHKNDTLTIRNLGYETARRPVAELLQTDTILLLPKVYAIKEVTITAAAAGAIAKKGVDGDRNDATYGMSKWTQIAVFMDNNDSLSGYIVGVAFYVPKSEHATAPFRLRIYNCDGDGMPSTDLLQEEVILKARRGGGWVSADLRPYNVILPAGGYFVCMEWINSGNQYWYSEEAGGHLIQLYAQKLGSLLGQGSPETWIKLAGGEWRKDKRLIGKEQAGYRNAMIKSEILIE